MSKKFLALVGSPRPNSTSSHLAQYLLDGLAAHGWQTQALVACAAVRQPEKWPDLEAAFREADAVAIVAPLYVDSVPAELMAALERLVHGPPRAARPSLRRGQLRLRRGAARTTLPWISTASSPATPACTGRAAWPLAAAGCSAASRSRSRAGRARHIIAAFDQAIAALDAGQDIPESATTGIRKQAIPTWAYFAMANLNMLIAAAKNGNLLKIGARPYRPCP